MTKVSRHAELYSSIIAIETSNSQKLTVSCNVVNVSSAARNGTIQMFAGDGSPLSSTNYHALQPGVGTGDAVSSFTGTAPVTLVYCKITVDGKADTIRGSLILFDSNGNTVVSVEAR